MNHLLELLVRKTMFFFKFFLKVIIIYSIEMRTGAEAEFYYYISTLYCLVIKNYSMIFKIITKS